MGTYDTCSYLCCWGFWRFSDYSWFFLCMTYAMHHHPKCVSFHKYTCITGSLLLPSPPPRCCCHFATGEAPSICIFLSVLPTVFYCYLCLGSSFCTQKYTLSWVLVRFLYLSCNISRHVLLSPPSCPLSFRIVPFQAVPAFISSFLSSPK